MPLILARLCSLVLVITATTAIANGLPQKPNHALTPGTINPAVTREILCVTNYVEGKDPQGKSVRNVSKSRKKQVFAEYHVDPASSKFEVDHLISLELGGSNDIKNLWPQSYTTQPYNAYMKDKLENKLRKLICSGELDLAKAQKEIAADWIVAYNKYVQK